LDERAVPRRISQPRLFSCWPSVLAVIFGAVTIVSCSAPSHAQASAPAPSYAQAGETDDGEAIIPDVGQNYNSLPPNNYATPQPAPQQAPQPQQPTPQQIERQNRMQENNIRNLIRSLGINSRDVQDSVIQHIASETQAREPMRAASGRLLQAMRTPGVTDAQLSVLLNDCRVAFDTDQTRRFDALTALKAKIGPDLTPRIESMILLLGLEGDVIITLPSPTMLAQMQRERQQLLKMVDGLKIETDSLRRERDDIKAERDALQHINAPLSVSSSVVRQTASAQMTDKGLYTVPAPNAAPDTEINLTDDEKELARLRDENDKLKKENKRLQRENTNLQRSLKTEAREANKDNKNEAKSENQKENR
jgi:hypothetical protein